MLGAPPSAAAPEGQGKRILVVGGSGAFGKLLVHGLAATTACAIVVAGRSMAKAEAVADATRAQFPACDTRALALDRDRITAEDLRALRAFAVVDAAGPFQGGAYRLPRAAIAAGLHYVDLADARDFVARFPQLYAEAKRAGVTAVTGASSTPAISNSVLDRLTHGWQTVETVEIAISPGNRAPRGLSVVRSILSYAGRPVRVLLDGKWVECPGWGLGAAKDFAGLGRRRVALCETPDLDLVPQRFPDVRTALFRAGMELPILHRGLSVAALPVRLGLVRSLEPASRTFRAMAGLLRGVGSDRGGMLVEASGRDADGRPVQATWALVAEAGEGPVVPTLPALAVIRMLAAGRLSPGARPCAGLLLLQQIEAELLPYRIRTEIAVAPGVDHLFVRALGEDFRRMPMALQVAHSPAGSILLKGEGSVEGAANLAGSIVASLFRFPRVSDRVPVQVTMQARPGCETWTRDFGGRTFRTTLSKGVRADLIERFGPFAFDLEIPAGEQGLAMRMAGWRIGPIPLPRRLAPVIEAREFVDDRGRFRFDVAIGLPLIGRIVRYQGWLVPEGVPLAHEGGRRDAAPPNVAVSMRSFDG